MVDTNQETTENAQTSENKVTVLKVLDKWTNDHPVASFAIVTGALTLGSIKLCQYVLSDAIFSANKKTIKYLQKIAG